MAPGHMSDVAALTETTRWSTDFPDEAIIGIWTSEIGRLNQLVVLSESSRSTEVRPTSPRDEGILRYLTATETVSLLPQRPITWKGSGQKMLYELRQYNFAPNGMDKFLTLFGEVVPLRETYSEIVAWWRPTSGVVQQMVHLWVYRDFEHRSEVRSRCMADPKWLAYLDSVYPLLGEMQSTLLIPTGASPMQ